jgi:NAD-dependent SIR2 family protein deacetylase
VLLVVATPIPNALVDAVRNRQAVLFAGAGISVGVLGISGGSLRDAIGAEIAKDYPDYDWSARSFEDVCDEYVAINDRTRLVDQLAARIPTSVAPSDAHRAAVKAFGYVITTNWDLLFEDAARAIGVRYHVVSSEDDVPAFHLDQHNLLKIHGSVDHITSLIATTDDYESYADEHSGVLNCVSELLSGKTVLFVGYGLRDEHVRRVLSTIRRRRGNLARRAYAVGFYDDVRRKLLASRGIDAINAKANDFLSELVTQAFGSGSIAGPGGV